MSYLCVNYNSICRLSPRSLKGLHPDNQDYLREHRWPPVWYLKDYDYYQRCMNELSRELNSGKKDCTADDKGCLCFSGGRLSGLTGCQVSFAGRREIKRDFGMFSTLSCMTFLNV